MLLSYCDRDGALVNVASCRSANAANRPPGATCEVSASVPSLPKRRTQL